MLTLNPIAKPKYLEGLDDDDFRITKLRVWREFCSYVEDDDESLELLEALRKVWKTLNISKRHKMAHARNIDQAFDWAESPQGLGYWMEWNDRIYEIKDNS